MKAKLFLTGALITLSALVVQPSAVHPHASLVGSWQLTLTPSVTPGITPITVAGLANFTSDGGAIGSAVTILAGPETVAAGAPPPGFSDAFGNWNGGPIPGRAVFKLISYVQGPDGGIVGTRTFQALVAPQSDPNQISGTYSYMIVDSLNNTISSSSGSISGTLISHFLPPAGAPN